MTLTEDNVLKIAVEQGVIDNEFNWKLVREHDGLTNQSKDIMWIEWNEDGTFKEKHDTFAIGRSLLMSPFNQFFTWQTTPITKIITRRPTADIFYIKFEFKYFLVHMKNDFIVHNFITVITKWF